MSEKLPFEENMDQQFNKLQLPDEEQSWQKMKALLDEEEDRRRPVFFWFYGLGLGILLLALATGAYFLFFYNNTIDSKTTGSSAQKTTDQNSTQKERTEDKIKANSNPSPVETQSSIPVDALENNTVTKENNSTTSKIQPAGKENKAVAQNKSKPVPGKQKNNGKPGTESSDTEIPPIEAAPEKSKANSVESREELNRVEKTDVNITVQSTDTESVSVNESKKNARKKDSTNRTRVKPEVDSTKDTGSDKKYFFSAGIGIQQQIPLGGQGSVPYDVYGREVSIADYIPSVFFRIHQEDKWFIMGEFRYGAPQKVNDFNYSQHSIYDTSSMTLSTTTMRLKKTYYHQLPLSFNYYVKPGWSVGLGAMYSRFYGAVSEKEIRNENVFTQDVSYSKSITNMKGFTDSFLHKSQVHFILNTDYQWKNFLLGMRFTKDIQPYIKYTQPDGMINEEKNYSLQVIFRWQFWKSQ